jgi:hypothetical protein
MAEATNIADNINAISPKKGLQAVRSASRKSHIRCQIRYRLVSNHKKTAAHFPVGFLAWGMNASVCAHRLLAHIIPQLSYSFA